MLNILLFLLYLRNVTLSKKMISHQKFLNKNIFFQQKNFMGKNIELLLFQKYLKETRNAFGIPNLKAQHSPAGLANQIFPRQKSLALAWLVIRNSNFPVSGSQHIPPKLNPNHHWHSSDIFPCKAQLCLA